MLVLVSRVGKKVTMQRCQVLQDESRTCAHLTAPDRVSCDKLRQELVAQPPDIQSHSHISYRHPIPQSHVVCQYTGPQLITGGKKHVRIEKLGTDAPQGYRCTLILLGAKVRHLQT